MGNRGKISNTILFIYVQTNTCYTHTHIHKHTDIGIAPFMIEITKALSKCSNLSTIWIKMAYQFSQIISQFNQNALNTIIYKQENNHYNWRYSYLENLIECLGFSHLEI